MALAVTHTNSKPVNNDAEMNYAIVPLINEIIGERKLSEFCEASGLSLGYVSRLRNGKLTTKPSISTLAKISCSNTLLNNEEIFSELLKLSNIDLDRESIRREIRVVEQTSKVLEVERDHASVARYGSLRTGAEAIGLLFSTLIAKGINLQPIGGIRPNDGLEFQMTGYQYESVIAIPGFCGCSHQLVLTERDILQYLLKCVSNQGNLKLYLILVDDKDIYTYMSEVLDDSANVAGCVLLADSEHSRFVEQHFNGMASRIKESSLDFVR